MKRHYHIQKEFQLVLEKAELGSARLAKSQLGGITRTYISCVIFYFLGGPGAEGGAWGHTRGVKMFKMLLKLNKALCLPVHQSRYEKQLKNQKFSIFALENRKSLLILFFRLFSRTLTDKQANKGLLLLSQAKTFLPS